MTKIIENKTKAYSLTKCENCGIFNYGTVKVCECGTPNPNYVEMEPMSNEELNEKIRKEMTDRNKYTPDKPYGKSGK